MPAFAGNVHGVVVQIKAWVRTPLPNHNSNPQATPKYQYTIFSSDQKMGHLHTLRLGNRSNVTPAAMALGLNRVKGNATYTACDW
jgi:hypothetical protein